MNKSSTFLPYVQIHFSEKKVALEKERKNGDKLLKYFIIKKPDSSNTFVGERGGVVTYLLDATRVLTS